MKFPRVVWVWFGGPIEPRQPAMACNDLGVVDPPLEEDELPGLLTGWEETPEGWPGEVEYAFPVHGYGMMLRYVDWFPADRLRVDQ